MGLRIKIAQMSTKNFWEKELVVPSNERPRRFMMRTAWKSFPRMHQMVYREKDAQSVRTKTGAMRVIGSYLRCVKNSAENIVEFAYDKSGSDKAVPKREREWEVGDILWVFKFFKVGDEALGSGDIFDDSAALTSLTTFSHVDKHYTHTLPQEPGQVVGQENGEDGSMCDDNSDGGSVHEESSDKNLEDMPSFVQIN